MPVSNKPWGDFTEADYTPEQFCSASLMDFNPDGAEKVKGLCYLPYKEPDGTINLNGIQATAGGRGLIRVKKPDSVSQDVFMKARRDAANKIISLYRRELERPAPDSIFRVAGKRNRKGRNRRDAR